MDARLKSVADEALLQLFNPTKGDLMRDSWIQEFIIPFSHPTPLLNPLSGLGILNKCTE